MANSESDPSSGWFDNLKSESFGLKLVAILDTSVQNCTFVTNGFVPNQTYFINNKCVRVVWAMCKFVIVSWYVAFLQSAWKARDVLHLSVFVVCNYDWMEIQFLGRIQFQFIYLSLQVLFAEHVITGYVLYEKYGIFC